MTDEILDDEYADEGFELPPDSEVPPQIRETVPTLLPGEGYVFKFPPLNGFAFEPIKRVIKEKKVLRLSVNFGRGAGDPLIVVKAPYEQFKGIPYRWSINNQERNRSRDKEVLISDMFYLLRSQGIIPQSSWKLDDYKAAMSRLANKTFGAKVEFQSSCRNTKTRWVQKPDGSVGEDPAGTMGCGKRLYHRDIEKYVSDGAWPEYVRCPQCGAVLRPFAELTGFVKG